MRELADNEAERQNHKFLPALEENSELYPWGYRARRQQKSRTKQVDDQADDIQPRYHLNARLETWDTEETAYKGEARTIIAPGGRIKFDMIRPEAVSDQASSESSRFRLRGELLGSHEFTVMSRDPLAGPRDTLDSLLVARRDLLDDGAWKAAISSVCVPLYNCFLPCGVVQMDSGDRSKPFGDPFEVSFLWKGKPARIGQLDLSKEARKAALLSGADAVPTAYAIFHPDILGTNPYDSDDVRKNIAAFLLAISFATLSPVLVRFWEYRDSHQRPIARFHQTLEFSRGWNSGDGLFPDRQNLASFLEGASSMTELLMDKKGTFFRIIAHLIASTREKLPGVGGVHEQFTAILQCFEELIVMKNRIGRIKSSSPQMEELKAKIKTFQSMIVRPLLDEKRTEAYTRQLENLFRLWRQDIPESTEKMQSEELELFGTKLDNAPEKILYREAGFGDKIEALEEVFGFEYLDSSHKRAFFRKMSNDYRTSAFHGAGALLGLTLGKHLEHWNDLSLYQLHAVRILLTVFRFSGFFQCPHHLLGNRLTHTSHPVALDPKEHEKDVSSAWDEYGPWHAQLVRESKRNTQ